LLLSVLRSAAADRELITPRSLNLRCMTLVSEIIISLIVISSEQKTLVPPLFDLRLTVATCIRLQFISIVVHNGDFI
jgi:hypothetical protein